MQNGKLVITLESNRQGFVGASERQPGQMTIIKFITFFGMDYVSCPIFPIMTHVATINNFKMILQHLNSLRFSKI